MVRPLQGVKTKVENDPSEPMSDKLERQRLEESKLVRGIFQDREVKGGSVKFPFKKFKGDQIVFYTLVDGEEYEIPLAVAKHLNSGCAYVKYSSIMGLDGKVLKNPKPEHRFAFKSKEFC